MAFSVELTHAAQRDIEETIDYIALDSSVRAKKWHDALRDLLNSLKEMPTRHAIIQESESLNRALRSVRHHSHRVIYEVNEKHERVTVVRIYHASRKPLEAQDL